MAIFCLSRDLADLERRLGSIAIGATRGKKFVRARELKADGAMTVLLKDALAPNLVQTLENNPAFVHGGPVRQYRARLQFGDGHHDRARPCRLRGDRSRIRRRSGRREILRHQVPQGGARAVGCRHRRHRARAEIPRRRGAARSEQGERGGAWAPGSSTSARHIDNVSKYGVPVIVAINEFSADTKAELDAVMEYCESKGVPAAVCTHWADGSKGTEELAHLVVDGGGRRHGEIQAALSRRHGPRRQGAHHRARNLWRRRHLPRRAGGGVPEAVSRTKASAASPSAWRRRSIQLLHRSGARRARPPGHTVEIREVRLSAGAEFIVAICGDIMTMPGLPTRARRRGHRPERDGRGRGAVLEGPQ